MPNLHHSNNPSCCSDNAGSLTHCATRELQDTHILKATVGGSTDPLKPTNRFPLRNKDIALRCLGVWSRKSFYFILFHFINFILFFLVLFRAPPAACGGSQARGQIRAVAAGLHHSHSSEGSEPHQQTTPQLTATTDPQPT